MRIKEKEFLTILPSPFPSDATDLVTNELVLKKNNEQNFTYFSKRFAVTVIDGDVCHAKRGKTSNREMKF